MATRRSQIGGQLVSDAQINKVRDVSALSSRWYREREVFAFLFFLSAITLASAFAVDLSAVDGPYRSAVKGAGIEKYVRDGLIVLVFLYSAVFYFSSTVKMYSIIAIPAILSMLFRSDDFSIYGALAVFRICSVFSIGILFVYALENRRIDVFGGIRVIFIFYLIATCVVAYSQVFEGGGFFGSTFFGPRILGFTDNPIILSQTMACIVIIILMNEKRILLDYGLIGVCFFLALLSGGRGGLLSILIAILTSVFVNRNKNSWMAYYYIFGIAILMPMIFGLLSDPAISGRVTLSQQDQDGRIVAWSGLLEAYIFPEYSSILFGNVLGLGANSLVGIFHADPGVLNFQPVIADSFFMFVCLSFGFFGLMIALTVIANLAWKSSFYYKILLFGSILPLIFSLNTFELQPANIFLVCAFVYVWRSGRATVGGDMGAA